MDMGIRADTDTCAYKDACADIDISVDVDVSADTDVYMGMDAMAIWIRRIRCLYGYGVCGYRRLCGYSVRIRCLRIQCLYGHGVCGYRRLCGYCVYGYRVCGYRWLCGYGVCTGMVSADTVSVWIRMYRYGVCADMDLCADMGVYTDTDICVDTYVCVDMVSVRMWTAVWKRCLYGYRRLCGYGGCTDTDVCMATDVYVDMDVVWTRTSADTDVCPDTVSVLIRMYGHGGCTDAGICTDVESGCGVCATGRVGVAQMKNRMVGTGWCRFFF